MSIRPHLFRLRVEFCHRSTTAGACRRFESLRRGELHTALGLHTVQAAHRYTGLRFKMNLMPEDADWAEEREPRLRTRKRSGSNRRRGIVGARQPNDAIVCYISQLYSLCAHSVRTTSLYKLVRVRVVRTYETLVLLVRARTTWQLVATSCIASQ